MKLLYITAQTPWGRGETFILEEMLEVKKQGIDLLVIPRNPTKEIFNKEADGLLENSIWLPLFDFKIIKFFLRQLFTRVDIWKILGSLIIYSNSPRTLIKNLAVFPKAVFVSGVIKEKKIEHMHAHWGSTTSTMAFIISRISGISWSLTLHRWDIKENNMLEQKIKSAKFARCISDHGKKELLGIVGKSLNGKIKVIYMGASVPALNEELKENKDLFVIALPANLVEKKGHKYLIEAGEILVKKGIINFKCVFYGDGPLKERLKGVIAEKNLGDYMKICGIMPHGRLLELYQYRKIDLVVLPSIVTKEGELEGIPVALMEAMAYGIPVISTATGGIPELLSNGAGIIIEEKSVEQLSAAILEIMNSIDLRKELSVNGHKKSFELFNIKNNVKSLIRLIENTDNNSI